MNISMYTLYALGLDLGHPTEAFRHFYDKGVRYADIVDDELSGLPLHLYCDYLGCAGMSADALVSMLDIACFDEYERRKNLAKVKGYIDQMEKLGIPILMPAPSVKRAENSDEFKKMRFLMTESFAELTDYAKGSGIKVAIENQSSLTRPDSKADDLLGILRDVPDLGFIFDTGNFFCVGDDALEAFRLLSDRIVHVHCKDWAINPFGRFVRENIPRFEGVSLGEGDIPLKELISLLKKSDYEGNLVLEINSSSITLDMLDKSAEFLNNELNRYGE